MNNDPLESDTSNWLKDIQVRSWEPEIILSSIITIGLLQLPDWIKQQKQWYDNDLDIDSYIPVVEIAIYWLTFGFIAHLVLRGVWVGMVGLSFVFPEGIKRDNIHYAPKFEQHVRGIAPIRQRIITLEKICSSVFAIAFLMFMAIVGAITFLTALVNVPAVLYTKLADYFSYSALLGVGLGFFLLFVLVLGAIYLIDFLTLGLLKKVGWLSRVYYPVYRFFNLITLSFLYRDIYYVLITNFTRWKIMVAILAYFTITVAVAYNRLESKNRLDLYEDRGRFSVQTENYSTLSSLATNTANATIQSDIIDDDVLRLFVALREEYEDSIKAQCNYQLQKDTVSNDQLLGITCLSDFYKVAISDSLYASPGWFYHQHPNTGREGILAWIDIAKLPRGKHVIAVHTPVKYNYAVIPFFKK